MAIWLYGDSMTLRINLEEAKEKKFRSKAMRRFGFGKGSISKALEEAIDLWLVQHNDQFKRIEAPTDAITGLLDGLTESSVELQHLGSKLFVRGGK